MNKIETYIERFKAETRSIVERYYTQLKAGNTDSLIPDSCGQMKNVLYQFKSLDSSALKSDEVVVVEEPKINLTPREMPSAVVKVTESDQRVDGKFVKGGNIWHTLYRDNGKWLLCGYSETDPIES